LPNPTILQGDDYFNPVLYTGNGGTQSITGVGFQPDFTWVKRRDTTSNHLLTDAVRGAGRIMSSNTTGAEVDDSAFFTSFNADGFSMAGGAGSFNASGGTYVGWNWKANGTGSSNTAGSITSTVSANTTAGFSIVTYSGTGANATVGHGLGVAPKMIFVKKRNAAGNDWITYNATVGNTKFLALNGTGTPTTFNIWQNTNPTSTVFSITGDDGVNNATATYVAYCFAEVAGYSSIGSYTGNASTDGTFVYLGFRPRYVLVKNTTNAVEWEVYDSARNPSNGVNLGLIPNQSDAEGTYSPPRFDFLSNGFKLRTSGGGVNGSGNTIIYMAFAENPFKNALAR
jgi:hypothetical protein